MSKIQANQSTLDQAIIPAQRRDWVTPVTIGALLFLRLVVLGLGGWLFNPPPAWLEPLFDTGTYLLTLFLIWKERDSLSEYHTGWLAVGIILAFKPLQTLFLSMMGWGAAMAFPNPPALIVCAAAAIMFVLILRFKPSFRKVTSRELGWFGIGILAGLIISIVLSFPMAAQLHSTGMGTQIGSSSFGLILTIFLRDFPYQLGYAAVTEEPLFRGFLWGYLRRLGWRELWIWLFQAVLFMLGHIYYVNRLPHSFWIIVPVGALALGWLAWRSRSIATSMAAHATLNATGFLFGQIAASWLFR